MSVMMFVIFGPKTSHRAALHQHCKGCLRVETFRPTLPKIPKVYVLINFTHLKHDAMLVRKDQYVTKARVRERLWEQFVFVAG